MKSPKPRNIDEIIDLTKEIMFSSIDLTKDENAAIKIEVLDTNDLDGIIDLTNDSFVCIDLTKDTSFGSYIFIFIFFRKPNQIS